MLSVKIEGLGQADTGLRKFAAQVDDLRAFWPRFAKGLADESQRLWPLRRKTGRLRQSLTWRGNRLGRFGIYEPNPDRLRFGSAVFYARYPQTGARKQRKTPLINIDEKQHGEQLAEWLRGRAAAAGLEVT